jgi:hypothetical protein
VTTGARAQEARTQANQMHNPKTKQVLLNIAENYDQLAEQTKTVVRSTKPPT